MPAVQVPEASKSAAAESEPGRLPSFDELMGIRREPEGPIVPSASAPGSAPSETPGAASAAPGSASAEPELTPLVLPGPGARPSNSVPSVRPQAATRTPESQVPPRSAASGAAQPPAAQPTAAAPSPTGLSTAPLPLGQDPLDDRPGRPTPVSAALAQPDADDYEKISVTGGEKKRFIPWIVVGAGAVVALIAAILIVFAVRGGGDEPAPTAAPTTSESPEPTPSEEADPEPSEPEETPGSEEAPVVEVGQTGDFPIPAWELNGQISAQLGWPQYRFEGENLILFGGTLLPQFPDSCAAMREGFGLTRLADGTLEVLRPAERCAAAPELYDQVWGLIAATIPTFQKAS